MEEKPEKLGTPRTLYIESFLHPGWRREWGRGHLQKQGMDKPTGRDSSCLPSSRALAIDCWDLKSLGI